VPELALHAAQRHAFASHLDGVRGPEPVWGKAAPRPCGGGAPQLGAGFSHLSSPAWRE
jgi:hypothetical protein